MSIERISANYHTLRSYSWVCFILSRSNSFVNDCFKLSYSLSSFILCSSISVWKRPSCCERQNVNNNDRISYYWATGTTVGPPWDQARVVPINGLSHYPTFPMELCRSLQNRTRQMWSYKVCGPINQVYHRRSSPDSLAFSVCETSRR